MSALYLKRVKLTDFRTFGHFDVSLAPGPSLTLLVGPNGMGKSTFFDALEWCLTARVEHLLAYLPKGTPEADYLTRRDADPDAHAVALTFSEGEPLLRSSKKRPKPKTIIDLLKTPAWREIHDVATYLALTHFLGQTSQQRFTSRKSSEQWEALKGPSGIERLEKIRKALRGRGTQVAFTRRANQQQATLTELETQLEEWQERAQRLKALRDGLRATGTVSVSELIARAQAVSHEIGGAPGEENADFEQDFLSALAKLRQRIEADEVKQRERMVQLETLGDLPNAYLAQRIEADPARSGKPAAETERSAAVQAAEQAAADTRAARDAKVAHATGLAAAQTRLKALEAERSDAEVSARLTETKAGLENTKAEIDRRIEETNTAITSLESEIAQTEADIAGFKAIADRASAARIAVTLDEDLRDQMRRTAEANSAAVAATEAASAARTRLPELRLKQSERAAGQEALQSALTTARRREGELKAAVAAIASHIHERDEHCPVCASHFAPGQLKQAAEQAANAQSAALLDLEQRLRSEIAEHTRISREIVAAELQLKTETDRIDTARREQEQVEILSSRIRALLGLSANGDIHLSVAQRAAQDEAALRAAEHKFHEDEARLAALTGQLETLRSALTQIQDAQRETATALLSCANDLRACAERIAARGPARTFEAISGDIETVQRTIADGETEARRLETLLQSAVERQAAAEQRRTESEQNLARIEATNAAAGALAAQSLSRWQEHDLDGEPNLAALDREIARIRAELAKLAQARETCDTLAVAGDQQRQSLELQALIETMTRIGGDKSADDPTRHEKALKARIKQAKEELAATEAANQAVRAFTEKLRDEARDFSTQFLAPLNDLINDFNDALLSRPGESVRFNAQHRVDDTVFDMGLRYRDPIEDALRDTGLPPQISLSEGQLAANGFSILCSASTAYPWSRWPALLLDDPLQHNDVIHTAAFVDVMRNLVEFRHYQLIMSSHDWAEAEFISRKFDAAGLPCSVIALSTPSKDGVRYEEPRHNRAALEKLGDDVARAG